MAGITNRLRSKIANATGRQIADQGIPDTEATRAQLYKELRASWLAEEAGTPGRAICLMVINSMIEEVEPTPKQHATV